MKTSPNYALRVAADKGRDDAFRFQRERSRYMLATPPPNPFLKATAEEFTAWQMAFDETLSKLEMPHATTR